MRPRAFKLFDAMPFLFGIGFIAPLIAQSMTQLQLPGPFSISHTSLGLLVGGSWGLIANIRSRWL